MSDLQPDPHKNARLCLDFINTLTYRGSANPEEHLPDFESLLGWAEQAGLPPGEADQAREIANSQPELASQAYLSAIELRERLFRLLSASAFGRRPEEQDLQAFNLVLGMTLAHAKLIPGTEAYRWSWSAQQADLLNRTWWLVVRVAAELLTSPELLDRLGQCADPECGWLFLDTSRNHTRKWCDINDCGNRAKQRRFQSKKREEKTGPAD